MKVWWCTEHAASFQMEAIPGPPKWDCWSGPIDELDHCVPFEMQLVPADARIVSEESEHCDECGQAYDEVYALPDALWAQIHERAPAGLLCPACALRRVVGALASVSDPTETAT